MNNEKNAKEILQQLEENYYSEMSADAETDFQKCHGLVSECNVRLLDNEIYIIDNKNIYDTNVIGKETSKNTVENLLYKLQEDEDIINSKLAIHRKSYNSDAEDGFSIYYPEYKRDDLQSIDVEVVTKISEFIDKVIYAKKENKYKSFYRGHGNWKFRLQPGIYRKGREEILQHESEYIREIISTYPQYFSQCKSTLDYLSVLQHNGFPTRLLDFSENPLIALYMACSTDGDSHADALKISVPNECFKFYDSDIVAILSNIALFDDNFSVTGENELTVFNQQKDVQRLVHQIRNEKPYFEAKIDPDDLQRIIFVKPKQSFDRISHQSGLFALFGIEKSKLEMPTIELMNPPCKITHYIIPSECKQKILEELSYLNITRASVYCDLENVSKYYLDKTENKTIDSIISRNEEIERKEMESLFK